MLLQMMDALPSTIIVALSTSTSCTASSKDKHLFYSYNMSLPGTATVQGIEVRLDAKADSSSGLPKILYTVVMGWRDVVDGRKIDGDAKHRRANLYARQRPR